MRCGPSNPTAGRFNLQKIDALVSVPVDADAWLAHLWAQNRPFSPDERAALPPDADTGPPCA